MVAQTFKDLLAGRYELLERIDSDSLGESFRALDRRLLCPVRLKRLHAHLSADALLRRRFTQELLALRRLSHPNVLTGYELGEDGETVFFTSELPAGRPLDELLGFGPLAPARALRLLLRLLEGLAHVHERGVLHRDLQPRHLHVGADDALKLGGFALGQFIDLATVTMASQLIASPRYRAPEVLRGQPAGVASDLYSAGLVLAEMLTGRVLFPEELLFEQVRAKSERVEDWPARLGLAASDARAAVARELLPGLLAPDPLERYRSAGEALEAASAMESRARTPAERGTALSPEALPGAAWREEACPACGEPVAAALGTCLACGLPVGLLTVWTPGPFLLVLRTVRLRNALTSELGDDPAGRSEALRLLEQFYGPLPESELRKLGRGVVVAAGVEARTADRLQRLFAARGLRLLRARLGAAGLRALRVFDSLRGLLPMPAWLFSQFLVVPIALFVVPNALFEAGFSLAVSTAAGMLGCWLLFSGVFAILFVPELPRVEPKVRWADDAATDGGEEAAAELIQEYRRIGDPGLRLAARRLLGELRRLGAESGGAGRAQTFARVEAAALRLLASVPPAAPEREGELLAEAQSLDARLATAPAELRAELEHALGEVHSALDRFAEAEALRTKLEERLGRCLASLRALRRPEEKDGGGELQSRAQQALDELLALKLENP
jgi:protein kinase-like protein